MLDAVKLALRISSSTTVFDAELTTMIAAALADLGLAGVTVPETQSALVTMAVVTYCRCHFGQPDDYERLKASYDEQKAQLATATGFTVWG